MCLLVEYIGYKCKPHFEILKKRGLWILIQHILLVCLFATGVITQINLKALYYLAWPTFVVETEIRCTTTEII